MEEITTNNGVTVVPHHTDNGDTAMYWLREYGYGADTCTMTGRFVEADELETCYKTEVKFSFKREPASSLLPKRHECVEQFAEPFAKAWDIRITLIRPVGDEEQWTVTVTFWRPAHGYEKRQCVVCGKYYALSPCLRSLAWRACRSPECRRAAPSF